MNNLCRKLGAEFAPDRPARMVQCFEDMHARETSNRRYLAFCKVAIVACAITLGGMTVIVAFKAPAHIADAMLSAGGAQ